MTRHDSSFMDGEGGQQSLHRQPVLDTTQSRVVLSPLFGEDSAGAVVIIDRDQSKVSVLPTCFADLPTGATGGGRHFVIGDTALTL